jgi:hypothetical protein
MSFIPAWNDKVLINIKTERNFPIVPSLYFKLVYLYFNPAKLHFYVVGIGRSNF